MWYFCSGCQSYLMEEEVEFIQSSSGKWDVVVCPYGCDEDDIFPVDEDDIVHDQVTSDRCTCEDYPCCGH